MKPIGKLGEAVIWTVAVVTWGLFALIPIALFFALIACGAAVLWWAAGFA